MVGKSAKSGGDAASMEVDTAELHRFADALSGKLDGAVTSALRRVGDQATADMQRAVRRGPATPGGRTNSREQAARGIRFEVRGGKLALISDPSSMERGREAFPAAWNRSSWSHPVFGRRPDVTQRGAGGWWQPASYADLAEKLLTRAGQDAMDEADR